ncbi:MAG: PAS domain S-box protein [Deltaproteobacteria bacterium]|nr:PAS domain S-box protein [Deltaproteobacteria bacterium]
MESSGIRNRDHLNRVTFSVGLTALAVIILILVLALTVYHAREKEMVRQFGAQQVSVAQGMAARVEDLSLDVRKSLTGLAGETNRSLLDHRKMAAVYAGMEGKISFTAVMDAAGAIQIYYPPSVAGRLGGAGASPLFRQVRETRQPAVGLLSWPDDRGNVIRVVAVGVPRSLAGGGFNGMILAAFPLIASDGDSPRPAVEIHSTWLVNDRGTVLLHPREGAIGRDVGSLEFRPDADSSPLREALLAGKEGYGEYRLQGEKGRPERSIVACAPVHFASEVWTVAVVTPYDSATALVRKIFLNIMIGAAGLILAVIMAAVAIVYAGRRRIRAHEARERLREREKWQERLVREKKTIEGIIEGSPIPTFVLDRDHKIILWNRACTELTGFAAGEMIGTEKQYIPFYNEKRPVIADLIIERDFESLEKFYGTKKIRKSATVHGAYEARDFYRNLGGKNRHLFFLAAPIYDENGEIIAAIETLQDVSKEEEMAAELRGSAETLRNRLQENIHLREEIESLYNYLQSIVDSLPDRLFVLSSDGTIHYMSRDVKDGIGMISRQAKGKHFLEIVPPEQHDFMKARWEEAKKGIFAPYEIEVKAKDGSKRTLLISLGPVRGSDRYVIVQRDITELKNLEERFYESQKMAAVGQLSAGIAHEVRNPLSSIKMSLQILEKRLHPAGNDQKRFEIALREVEHLEELVNDVLIFAKPAVPHKEQTDIRKVLRNALALGEKGIADKGIRVQTRFADALPLLSVDAVMLAQAFLNLILNAVDAMSAGGLLTVSAAMVGDRVPQMEVEIGDDGCGIDEEDMRHLFNPFFTRKKHGTGLGLTQVKKIIDLHQGIVDIFSSKGEGTRVRIRFPGSPDDPASGRIDESNRGGN